MRKLLLVGLILSGCATEEAYRNYLNTWLNHSEAEFVSKWGAPHRIYDHKGVRMLTYVRSDLMTLPGTEPTFHTTIIDDKAYTHAHGGTPAKTIQLQCETTFHIVNERVSKYSFRGNDCVQ